jgi:hypothetical protein
LTFAARDRLLQGEGKFRAFCNAMLVVGPACVLTHATAALSFIALQFSEPDLIRTFGEAGLVATLIAMFAVLMLVPLLGILLVRNESVFVAEVRGADSAVNVLRRFCAWIAARMVATPAFTACSALCHHPAAASLPGVQMASALHIVCAHCDAINRVPRERFARRRQVRLLPSAAL